MIERHSPTIMRTCDIGWEWLTNSASPPFGFRGKLTAYVSVKSGQIVTDCRTPCSIIQYLTPGPESCGKYKFIIYQHLPTGCLETLTGGFWVPVVTRKHLLEGAGI